LNLLAAAVYDAGMSVDFGCEMVKMDYKMANKLYIQTSCDFMGLRCRLMEEGNRKLPGHICGTGETEV